MPALPAAAGSAFGTTVRTDSAQQSWMHGPAQLFMALGVFLLVRGRGSPRAGLALGLAAAIRPVDALAAAAGFLIARRRRFAARYLAWGLPAVAFLATYYLITFRGPRDSYGGVPWFFPPPGWLGLLISPSRGTLRLLSVPALRRGRLRDRLATPVRCCRPVRPRCVP